MAALLVREVHLGSTFIFFRFSCFPFVVALPGVGNFLPAVVTDDDWLLQVAITLDNKRHGILQREGDE